MQTIQGCLAAGILLAALSGCGKQPAPAEPVKVAPGTYVVAVPGMH